MIKLLMKLLSKFMKKHKILHIVHSNSGNTYNAYWIKMDCDVQPDKIIVLVGDLYAGHYFDPHFSNPRILARYTPSWIGWKNALKVLD